jgi:hypothetical protein
MAEYGFRYVAPGVAAPRLPLNYSDQGLENIITQFEHPSSVAKWDLSFEPDLGWVPTPSVVREAKSVRYRHNAAGLRADREYAQRPPSGARRYAAYGDSFTYCADVELDDCWTHDLEEALPGTEVLNFGVGGYAPDQA